MIKREDYERAINIFQLATGNYPTKEIAQVLAAIELDQCIEVMLVYKQSPSSPKNPLGFIRKAIEKGWKSTAIPVPKCKLSVNPQKTDEFNNRKFPFYNWLEEQE